RCARGAPAVRGYAFRWRNRGSVPARLSGSCRAPPPRLTGPREPRPMSDTLMISVSGIRGHVGTDLTPELVARYAAALGAWVRTSASGQAAGATRAAARPAVVLGRDARTSGSMF